METILIWSIGVLHLVRPFSSIQRLFLFFSLKFIYYILTYTDTIFIPYTYYIMACSKSRIESAWWFSIRTNSSIMIILFLCPSSSQSSCPSLFDCAANDESSRTIRCVDFTCLPHLKEFCKITFLQKRFNFRLSCKCSWLSCNLKELILIVLHH